MRNKYKSSQSIQCNDRQRNTLCSDWKEQGFASGGFLQKGLRIVLSFQNWSNSVVEVISHKSECLDVFCYRQLEQWVGSRRQVISLSRSLVDLLWSNLIQESIIEVHLIYVQPTWLGRMVSGRTGGESQSSMISYPVAWSLRLNVFGCCRRISLSWRLHEHCFGADRRIRWWPVEEQIWRCFHSRQ